MKIPLMSFNCSSVLSSIQNREHREDTIRACEKFQVPHSLPPDCSLPRVFGPLGMSRFMSISRPSPDELITILLLAKASPIFELFLELFGISWWIFVTTVSAGVHTQLLILHQTQCHYHVVLLVAYVDVDPKFAAVVEKLLGSRYVPFLLMNFS